MSDAENYQLVKKLGAGISGVVYLSRNASVAVRQFVSPSPRGSAEAQADRDYFLDGARRAERLSHPRIVKILEVLEEEGEVFVAMENVSAETLGSVLSKRSFTLAQANDLLRALAMTLDFAHQQGVVHGDFKPSNVFMMADGSAKISDFAISPRGRRNRGPLPQHWIHPYLSPEHLLAPETISPESDQYSLAAIAYHLYTGEAPHAGIASALRKAMAEGRISFPESAGKVLLNALSRERGQRYRSCTEFVDALEASVAARPTTLAAVPAAAEPGPSGRSWYVETGLVLLVLLGAAWWFTVHRKPPEPKQTAAQIVTPMPPVTTPAEPKKTARARPRPAQPRSTPAEPAPEQPRVTAKTTPVTTTQVTRPLPREPEPRQPEVVRPTQQPPPPPPPRRSVDPVPPPQQGGYDIAVLSRTRKLEEGLSFSYRDPGLGELGHGDLKAVIQTGGRPPKGKLTLEWFVDDVPMEVKTVAPNQLVEYGNEPTTGQYRVVLKLAGKPVKSFAFRITP